MDSIWIRTSESAPKPPLYGDIQTEIAVVGGGMAGILTALLLHERGKRVAVLEAERVGGGQTANTTAKITAQHGVLYADLIARFGQKQAKMYATANQRAVDTYRRIVEQYHIDCAFQATDAVVYTHAHEDVLRREAEAAYALGLPASFTTKLEGFPLRISGAVRFSGQAQFHPLRFLDSLAELLTVYERTPVERIEGHTLFTPRGRVKADTVILTAHYPFVNFPGLMFARMHQERAYVLALENAPLPPGMYYGYEPYTYSMRSYGALTLLGGCTHRSGENRQGGRYEQLRSAARVLFPESREVCCWSAQDCMTASGMPYIGKLAEGMYVATGFGKWGMTSSMAAAEILTGLLCDGAHPDAEIFDPRSLKRQQPMKIASEGAHAVRGLTRHVLHGALPLPIELPVGHGAPAEVDGKMMGVYRAAPQEYYAVELRCPHLGCRLEWNPDEKTWDCPCHGSRFDVTGKRLTEPAQTPLRACRLRPDGRTQSGENA